VDERRISRREVLRNLSLAGAAAWAAPLLTSVPARASADTSPHLCCKGFCFDCSCSMPPCGTCGPFGNSWCFAYFDRYGRPSYRSHTTSRWWSVCAENVYCSQALKCLKATDCPRGYACITLNGCTECGADYGICTKKCRSCGAPAGGRRAVGQLGRTAAGVR
jgi:hypothetical protein